MDGYRTLKAGQSVQFDIKPSDKGLHAINIRALDGAEASAPAAKAEQAEPA
jgi:CspA family cold shock protein